MGDENYKEQAKETKKNQKDSDSIAVLAIGTCPLAHWMDNDKRLGDDKECVMW